MEITIKDIIEFIKKAINNSNYQITARDLSFCVRDVVNNKCIAFHVSEQSFIICGTKEAFLDIEHKLTEREKLLLEELRLSVKERNEKIAINLFNHFLDKELTIDDIDEED